MIQLDEKSECKREKRCSQSQQLSTVLVHLLCFVIGVPSCVLPYAKKYDGEWQPSVFLSSSPRHA